MGRADTIDVFTALRVTGEPIVNHWTKGQHSGEIGGLLTWSAELRE